MPGREREESPEVILVHQHQVGADQLGVVGQDVGDDKRIQLARIGAEGDAGFKRQTAHALERGADHDGAALDAASAGHHEGVVGLDDGIVVVTPEPPFHLLHAPDASDLFQVSLWNQVMAPRHHALQDDLRRIGEHPRRLVAQRM